MPRGAEESARAQQTVRTTVSGRESGANIISNNNLVISVTNDEEEDDEEDASAGKVRGLKEVAVVLLRW